MIKKLLLIIAAISTLAANATHNKSGEITYRALDSMGTCFTYEIRITTFTRGASPADRCSLIIYFGDGDSAEFWRSNGTCGAGALDHPVWQHSCNTGCNGEVVTNETKKSVYIGKHTFPGPGTYLLSVFDPNRNAGIINIPSSVNVPFYIEAKLIISPIIGCNSSPTFINYPLDTACTSQCFKHKAMAIDPDGDSLSYKLGICLGDSGKPIPGFTQPNILGGGVYELDSLNGTLQWCNPQLIGEFNTAIYVYEWRKIGGKYYNIGFIERDMQINVSTICAVGINEEKNKTLALAFPNPAQDYIQISTSTNSALTIEIITLTPSF